MKETGKTLLSGMFRMFIYSAVLFILAYTVTLLLVVGSRVLFTSVSIEMLSYVIGTAVFLLLAGTEVLFMFKSVFWSPVMIVAVIPVVIFGILKAIVTQTTYSFDVRNPPEKIKKLKTVVLLDPFYMKKYM